ncbi:helix-turn-helix transcriptional regulator [Kamptonema animale CS-326]|jgi:putative transcriptional regulator|uniref:helix-turn-helix domain-containing protein n=1 Tax=Kamptonema animale TaxID=92934 RepID=UPI00232ECF6E|nr:helix-turn-helix transcriptional regulator [Kamptonema animale]MDB9514131.1 helix-turn-helix transcriptional regulator [Kamptonema animale CS-326]
MRIFFVMMARKKRNQDLGNMPALQQLMDEVGLTQTALAKLIPDKTGMKTLSQASISRWLSGDDEPELTIAQVKALCRALGKNLDELPNYFGPPKRTGSSPPGE